MKRTYGNTKPERRGRRIRILVAGQCVGHVVAPTMRQGLRKFYLNQLKPFGGLEAIYVGNIMTVLFPPPMPLPHGTYSAGEVVVTALEVRS